MNRVPAAVLLTFCWVFLAGSLLLPFAVAIPAYAGTGAAVVQPAPVPEVPETPAPDEPVPDHDVPPVWLVLPFAVLLLLIATGPLLFQHHWHDHYPKYSLGLGLIVAGYYLLAMDGAEVMLHALAEYLSFIALVASLFVAAGGIYVGINARGTPRNNVLLLLVASIVANFVATTGAAMLFIRSYLRLNRGRVRPYHVVFFIFLVANVGGALTPIGDPPLFLGFLRGVPFFWTLTHIWYVWLPTTLLLLAIFYFIDRKNRDVSEEPAPGRRTIHVVGKRNFVWVAILIGSVFLDPNVIPAVPDLHEILHAPFGLREVIMFTVAVAAYRFGSREALKRNDFNFEPIREVAWLFVGIFATMQPALQVIGALAQEHAAVLGPGVFYWATGVLSGVLDNAPTYLNFVSAALGKYGLDVDDPAAVSAFAEGAQDPETTVLLQAISIAAVFFGALTYIGNAPNFMVKAIAEDSGVATPPFTSYLVRYALPILIPVYFLIYAIFFSGWVVPLPT